MSHCRKNLLRDKVIGKKCIYLGRNTLYRQNVGHLRNQEWPWEKYTPQTRVWAALEGECSLKMWCGYVLWLGSAGKESWVRSLGWEDPLEKAKATHSSILAWRIPWTVQCMGSRRVGHN